MNLAFFKGSATTNAHQAETAAKNAASHYERAHTELALIRKILDNIENKVPDQSRNVMYSYKKAMQAYERIGKHSNDELHKIRVKLEELEPALLAGKR